MEWILAILILCASLANAESSGAVGEKCKTQDDLDGECMVIHDCRPYIQLLKRGNLTADERNFLRKSQCGLTDRSPMVCCPSPGVLAGEKREGLDSHPNWKLLNMDSCGDLNTDILVGGYIASPWDYQMLALLSFETSTGKKFLCSGALINDRYVLTAAHCVRLNMKMMFVRLGEHDLQSEPDCEDYTGEMRCKEPVQDINVEEVIPHPHYDSRSRFPKHDIALIRLEKPAKLNIDGVMPICVPRGAALTKQYENTNMEVPGWLDRERNSLSNVKLRTTYRTISNEECSGLYSKFFTLDENQICAGGRERMERCSGDDGGPLIGVASIGKIPKRVVVGVSSFGLHCSSSMPVVYTRVAPYMKWILDTMKP